MEVNPVIRQYIVENFLFGDGKGLKDNTSFTETGLIDSTGILELVAFIEKQFSITMEDNELIPENLDSLSQMCKYIEKKMGK